MQEERRVSLWLPLFLAWPLAIALGLLLAIIALWPSGWGRRLLVGSMALVSVACALRGLAVEVENPKAQVTIVFH